MDFMNVFVAVEEVGQCVPILYSFELLRSSTQSNKTGKLTKRSEHYTLYTVYAGKKFIEKKNMPEAIHMNVTENNRN